MRIVTNKLYIDYLDYSVSKLFDAKSAMERLRFDLLLFSEDVLCISVPACVKLKATTQILMNLTPFWENGKIRLIMDKKHRQNPWNYFNNRKRVLEKGFTEEQLVKHFEYIAYNSEHTSIFYNMFIGEILHSNNEIYIGRDFDADAQFRNSVYYQVEHDGELICSKFGHLSTKDNIEAAIHMGGILNNLQFISQDTQSLFQRAAVEERLKREYNAREYETAIINRILDRGFAYANATSCNAVPLSLVANRLTGKSLINILKSSDAELYTMINELDWGTLYRLSINDTWLDFVYHLNKLLVMYQKSKNNKESIFSASKLGCSMVVMNLVTHLYENALDQLKEEMIDAGLTIFEASSIKDYSDKFIEYILASKAEYWDTIREIEELLSALKVVIRSLEHRYKGYSQSLRERGFIVNLYGGEEV